MKKNGKRFKGRFTQKKGHRQVKDRLFRFLFERDREALLQLYNALNGTSYSEASELQMVTLENAVYVVMKNDLAFVIAGVLSIYEPQSTFNPNMPARFLFYLGQEYHKIVEHAPESPYGSKLIMLPTPQCIVFYNGEREMPKEQILKLSDAFESKSCKAGVELEVRVLNINYGYNEKLMEQCQVLKEYALFVETSREYIRRGRSAETALNEAVDFCIEKNILAGFLRQYRAEVLGMLLEEFDVKKYERSLRQDGREEGREEGIRALVEVCQEFGMSKEDILVRLETRFSMGADSAKQYFEKYQKQL